MIGTLGRIVPEKNLEDLVNSASMLNNSFEAYFLIGGEGPILPKLKNLAEKRSLRNIKFLGEVREAVKFHQVCDVFVLTSTREGLSTSLQEAMATGSVPVAVDGYGCPELIQNGWNGYLFKPRDVEDLANKIYLAAHNPELGAKARHTILEKFNIEKNVRRYIELYRELI